jgi:tripartite-type tricarboxylate transporter receptor subunit TctC
MFLFVHPSLPVNSLREFVALARSRAGSLAIGSGGNGTTTHLVAELLQARAGIRLTHVPYKGAGPALVDVAAGQIPATFTSMATAAPLAKAGKLRVLGVTSPKRVAAFPDVPTFAEGGISGFIVEHWWGVLAPARVAPTIVSRLHDAIVKAVGTPEVRERFEALAVESRTEFPREFQAFLAAEVKRWAKVVSEAGVKVN